MFEEEHVLDAIKSFMSLNEGDDATELLLINLGCEIFEVSQDKFMEMMEEN